MRLIKILTIFLVISFSFFFFLADILEIIVEKKANKLGLDGLKLQIESIALSSTKIAKVDYNGEIQFFNVEAKYDLFDLVKNKKINDLSIDKLFLKDQKIEVNNLEMRWGLEKNKVDLEAKKISFLGDYLNDIALSLAGFLTYTNENYQGQFKVENKDKLIDGLIDFNYHHKDASGLFKFVINPITLGPQNITLKSFHNGLKALAVELRGNAGASGVIPFGKKVYKKMDIFIDAKLDHIKYKDFFAQKSTLLLKIASFSPLKAMLLKPLKSNLVFVSEDLVVKQLKILGRFNKNKLTVSKLNGGLWGGLFWANNFVFDTKKLELALTKVQLSKIELNQLLKLGLKDKVKASGVLSGVLPVESKNGQFVVKNGLLKNEGSGYIQYLGGDKGPLKSIGVAQVDLLLGHIKDLKYDKIQVDISSDKNTDFVAKLKVFGRKRSNLSERPLDLNVNLSGNLSNIIKSTLGTISMPDIIEKRIEKMTKKGQQ